MSKVALSENPASVARKIADAKIRAIETGVWLNEVRNRLRVALNDPLDEIVRAIASVYSLWEGMEKEPEPADVVIAWHRRKPVSVTVASVRANTKQNMNDLLRQKVSEVCASQGWKYVQAQQIAGLKYQLVEGNGYHLVP